MTTMASMSAVLAHDEILQRLNEGQLFRNDSWDRQNIRAAAYDLRIANDFMIVPEPEYPSGRRYRRGEKRDRPVILRPGEVAFFSTAERICIPWNVSANIGIKFGYARRGILILTGLLVDPGFGLRRDGDSWVAKPDERLHFLVANVGPNSIVMSPGKDKIASIQFLHVSGKVLQKEVTSTEDMDHEFFDAHTDPKLGLSFFNDMTELRVKFAEFTKRFDAVEGGSKMIVMFGVYLLTASIFVGALVVLLSMVSSNDLTVKLTTISSLAPKTWRGTATLVGGGITLGIIINSVRKLMESLVTSLFRWRQEKMFR